MLDKETREMFEHKIRAIQQMIAEEVSRPDDMQYGVRLHHPERKNLDIMLDVEALRILAEHYRSRIEEKHDPLNQDGIERRVSLGLENYRENKLADAAANFQLAGNRILEIIDERFKESQHEH